MHTWSGVLFGVTGKSILSLIAYLGVFITAYLVFLVVFQRSFIYFPSKYPPQIASVVEDMYEIQYQVDGDQQVAYYIPPRSGDKIPKCLWLMLGGNGSLALGWIGFTNQIKDPDTAFLLFDYPGYGKNQGSPSLIKNNLAVEKAYQALLNRFQLDTMKSPPYRLGGVAHSLGAPVILNLAEKYPMDMLLLLSPFTSMQDMVKYKFSFLGRLLSLFVWDKYEVYTKLSRLRPNPPKTVLVHGAKDEIIPVSMSRSMGEDFSDYIEYIELKDANHNFIYDNGQLLGRILKKMCQDAQ